MKIEAGKFYRDTDGNKVGPMDTLYDNLFWVKYNSCSDDPEWTSEGIGSLGGRDLVAEWVDGDLLKDLDPQEGDVFEMVANDSMYVGNKYKAHKDGRMVYLGSDEGEYYGYWNSEYSNLNTLWKVVSRAADTLKTFGELSPEEKGALLLAHHEGKRIEANTVIGYMPVNPIWNYDGTYRIAPEPKRIPGTCEVDDSGEVDTSTWVAS